MEESKGAEEQKSDVLNEASDSAVTEDVMKDIENCAAFQCLDDLCKNGHLNPEIANMLKTQYAQLHTYVLETFESEKSNLKLAKQMNQELLGEKIKLEKISIRKHEETQVVMNLDKERDSGLKELGDFQQRTQSLQYELVEANREYSDLQRKMEQIKKENAELVEPELQAISSAINELEEELASKEALIRKEQRSRDDLSSRAEILEQEMQDLHDLKITKRQALSKIKMEPDRIKKQAEIVETAAKSLSVEVDLLVSKTQTAETDLQAQTLKKKEVSDVFRDLTRKLDLHRTTIEQRERDVDAVRSSLDLEKNQHQDLLAQKVQLELHFKQERQGLKSVIQELALANKDFELQKRELKKKIQQIDSLVNILPGLSNIKADASASKDSYKYENKHLRKKLTELKQEVDVFIATFLRQESTEKEKRQEIQEKIKEIKEIEHEISLWILEENKQKKQISLLNAQRDIKAREASKACELEKVTITNLRVKELAVFDLSKKFTEMNSSLREFSALYDVVKNERNKYVNLIQASSQALAEMKEKIKILHNEVEILRNESVAKDKTLAKERLAHQTSQCQRDAGRLETNKCQNIYREKQNQVEQQIVQVDKLNSIINSMEKDMLRLKKQYELAVEHRNYTGVQLVDRNDELCILYEKSNVQEETLKQGEIGLRKQEEEIRVLSLQTAELQRKIEVVRKQLLKLPELANKILSHKRELTQERELAEKLCEDLETPQNQERWRALDGDDPDIEQLVAKAEVLEERLNSKKEQGLEKELILEEITELSEKLKVKAEKGKSETLKLAQNVNTFQTRIKEITRKMMAIVSELSMYQATAMRLQQEKHDREKEAEDAEERLRNNQPPTEEAENEWYRMERKRLERLYERERVANGHPKHSSDPMSGGKKPNPKTRAEPRPNAYVPEGERIAVPRPYGGNAPFKPQPCGSTMRHIRNPKKTEIEI